MKLQPDFGSLRANILNRDSLLNLASVLAMLLREATRFATEAFMQGPTSNNVALAAQQFKRKDFSKLQSFECKELGHIASHCRNAIFAPTAIGLVI